MAKTTIKPYKQNLFLLLPSLLLLMRCNKCEQLTSCAYQNKGIKSLVSTQKILTLWFRRLFFSPSLGIRCFFRLLLPALSPEAPLRPPAVVGLQIRWRYSTLNSSRVQSHQAQPRPRAPTAWGCHPTFGNKRSRLGYIALHPWSCVPWKVTPHIPKVYLQLCRSSFTSKHLKYSGLYCSSVECSFSSIKTEMSCTP